ncbi:hypothetical protein [Geodermatophilus sp. URMC 62]|uniref:hypothetical protein n=1 Tax=Geodermatophilus sp. URMC 62 TaxID=3423414 RepID=UPI00406C837B
MRFRISPTVRIETDEVEWALTNPAETPVTLRSLNQGEPLKDAASMQLRGGPYSTAVEASSAGQLWQSIITRAFARYSIGADYGSRAFEGRLSAEGLRWYQMTFYIGQPLNDESGVQVFECYPPPRFIASSAQAVVGRYKPQVEEAVRLARLSGERLDDLHMLAFELYSGSFFQPSADARFLMLMMALETLIQPRSRAPEVRAHVDEMIRSTNVATLPDNEKASIVGSLEWLRSESISQAGRRTVSGLGDRRYKGLRPGAFFTECYELRSALVHGHAARPPATKVNEMAGPLQDMVGHLISGELAYTLAD